MAKGILTNAQLIREFGGPEVLTFEQVEVQPPAKGEVLLRHTAIGMNMMEVGLRNGTYPGPPLPFVPGVEAAGVVEAVGDAVEDVCVGDRVVYAGPPVGSYAEMRTYPVARLIPIPEDVPDDLAAAAMVKCITAESLLHRTVDVKQGMSVLIHAAAGATGSVCVQLAKHLGAEVFGVVSTSDKAEYIRTLGCDHALVYGEGNFADQVLEITGGVGVHVAYDSVGRDTFEDSIRCTHYLGTIGLFGVASGMPAPVALMELDLETAQRFVRPSIYAYTKSREDLLCSAERSFQYLREGAIKVSIHGKYSLRDAANAHRAVESRLTKGSLLICP